MRSNTQRRLLSGVLQGLAIGAALACSTPAAMAAVAGYQSQSDFNAAISGWSAHTTDFEGEAVGSTYPAGTGPAASGFTISLSPSSVDAGFQLPAVGSGLWTTSGANYLGLDNADTALESGDILEFSFAAPVRAFGLFVIGGHDLVDIQVGGVRLTVDGTTLASSATPVAVSGAGDYAFYLGFASTDGSSFSTATLSIGDGVSLLPVAVDDVTLASPGNRVPEPGSLLLACSALGLAWVRARPSR